MAEHITDLAGESQILVINSEDPSTRSQYAIEITADTLSEPNPTVDSSADEILSLIDILAIDAHKKDDGRQVAETYDDGIGQGYIGFSESMRFLRKRQEKTWIKSISFSDRENLPRLYTDAAAVTAGTKGYRYEKCLELMNVMAEADILSALSVQDDRPQYLLLSRKTPYKALSDRFPIYEQMWKLADNEKNQVILTP